MHSSLSCGGPPWLAGDICVEIGIGILRVSEALCIIRTYLVRSQSELFLAAFLGCLLLPPFNGVDLAQPFKGCVFFTGIPIVGK